MKFVIIGPALSGNKGAAAMLESSVQTLTAKYPEAEFTLLSHYPKADTKLNTYRNVKIVAAKPVKLAFVINPLSLVYKILPPLRKFIRKHQPAIRAIAEADAVLEEGGITFNDGREIYLLFNVATILPALFIGTPVIKCAQALGPFKNPINRLTAKIFLPKMKVIVARGDYTYKNLQGLKLKNVVQGADYAFSLAVTKQEAKAADTYASDPIFAQDRLVVGVSPSSVIKKRLDKSGQDYTQITVDFVNQLIGKGYNVALLPHSMSKYKQKQGFVVSLFVGKSHNDDMALCKEVYDQIAEKKHCMLLDDEIGAQPLRILIGRCDVFMASRFHAMVASLSVEVPVMVLGWSHKYAEVLKMFDLENQAFDYKKLSSASLLNSMEKTIKNRDTIAKNIRTHLPQVKALSKKHVEYIAQVVED